MYHSGCNFAHYYCQQAGTGLPHYKGSIQQRGYGIWSTAFKRIGIPLLKFFGKQGLSYVSNVGNEYLNNQVKFKDALKKNAIASGKNIALSGLKKGTEVVSQYGTGRRRRTRRTRRTRVTKKPKKTSKKRT